MILFLTSKYKDFMNVNVEIVVVSNNTLKHWVLVYLLSSGSSKVTKFSHFVSRNTWMV